MASLPRDWRNLREVELMLDGTSATVLQLIPVSKSMPEILVFGADAVDASKPAQATVENGSVQLANAAGEFGAEQEVGVLLPDDNPVNRVIVNGKSVAFNRNGRYVSAHSKFTGSTFAHSQEITLQTGAEGSLAGSFRVPGRIVQQLAKRRELWPIPWTKQDYETTWLAPERLLLFVQFAEPDETMNVKMSLDGSPLELKRAYASVREHPASFVGFYADVSNISPDTTHTIQLNVPKIDAGRFQGVFFDNVETEYTEQLAP